MRIAWKPLGWGLFAVLVLSVFIGSLVAHHFWNQALEQNGIETLEWQGLDISFSGITLGELKLVQSVPERDLDVEGQNLSLTWRWPEWGRGWQPELTTLKAGNIIVDLHTKSAELSEAKADLSHQGWVQPEWLARLPEEISIQQFEIRLPCESGRCSLSGGLDSSAGALKVNARLPQPWPLPGVGSLSGNAEVDLKTEQGVWQPEILQADLKLSHPAAWIKSIPELMRPDLIELSVRPAKAVASSSPSLPALKDSPEPALLPLEVSLTSRGGANLAINSHLAVSTNAPWRAQLGNTQVTAVLPELQVADWQLTRPKLETSLTGWLDASSASLTFGKTALLQAEKIEPLPETSTALMEGALAKGVSLDLAGATLKASYSNVQSGLDELALAGPLGIKSRQIQHSQLQSQSWEFNGRLAANLDRTDVEGVLKAKTGTSMNLDLKFPYQGPLFLEASMRVSGENEADALSRILTAWPEVLSVSGGNVSASATYEQPQNGTMRLVGKLVFADWSGTYDRTAWSRMNGSTEFLLEDNRVRVTTPELTIEEVNPGLPVGPGMMAGRYEAPLDQLSAGRLALEQARLSALGGEIRIHPGGWNLAEAPLQIPVELKRLSLARLFQLYPADGLAGTGILSGTVPVLFDPATGIKVEKGRIDAIEPGGRLQVTVERLKALASQSESMKLVARALEDFHYSVLDSGIDYDENGNLLLSLHLEGNSPEVGKGQPVVLNINIEENIPALLTSLQLSGRVSDAVAERVKDLLKKRARDSDELLE